MGGAAGGAAGASTLGGPVGMGIMAGGMGLQALGSWMGGRNKKAPPPNPMFPELQGDFLKQLKGFGGNSFDTMNEMATTGAPVDVGGVFDSIVQASARMRDQGRANVLENFGASGNRFGSAGRNALVDYETQSTKDLTSILTELTRTSAENAATRRLQAAGTGFETFGNFGGAMTPSTVMGGGSGSVASSAGSNLSMIALLRAMKII